MAGEHPYPSIVNGLMARLREATGVLTVPGPHGYAQYPLRELWPRVVCVVKRLRSAGVKRGDRVGLVGANGLDLIVADLACIYGGFVSAPFEPSMVKGMVDACLRFDLRMLLTGDPTLGESAQRVWSFDELRPPPDTLSDQAAPEPAAYTADEVITLKFTSGSTGQPKAIGARVGSIDASIREVDRIFQHRVGDRLLVFLPLSLLQQRYWIYSAVTFGHDVIVTSHTHALAALKAMAPTVVMGVPGYYQALQAMYESRLSAQAGLADAARAYRSAHRAGTAGATPFEPVFGWMGGKIRYLWTGSAPAPLDTLRFFNELGIPLYEGYGMNETCIVSKNHPGAVRIGSVGRVLPNKRVRVDAIGQILVSAAEPVNFRYAHCEPGESERMFDAEGTVTTGDLGHLDRDGFLYIDGRVTDIIALTSGKKVLPRLLEERLCRLPSIAQCVVYGDGKPHLVALVVRKTASVTKDRVQQEIAEVNRGQAAHEKVHHVVLTDGAFTLENELLTSQFKPRRKLIFEKYRGALEACYAPRQATERSQHEHD